ncbi:MAG: transglycosylase SLT domain-containing protein, partial [Chthoniobacteraceae bacterium]|nr:transglycosylase SLT domain-containing protein [Chthoniobacteraceae bacterium]
MIGTILGVATVVVGSLLATAANAATRKEYVMLNPKKAYPKLGLALAEKWGQIFGVPPQWIASIQSVETGFRPLAYNQAGKAHGMMQIKLPTALDIIRRGKQFDAWKNPAVKATLRKFSGNGQDLFDPDLNVMLGSMYLLLLGKKFGGLFPVVSAAYNQGEGAVAKALAKAAASGQPFEGFL